MGTAEEDYRPDRPSYSAARQYPSRAAWAHETARRLRRWGFTTIGGWSDYELFGAAFELDLPMAPVLHAGSTAGIPWLDMWDPAVVARVDEAAKVAIATVPRGAVVLGYYSDNELGWWNHVLVDMTLKMPSGSGQRARTVSMLKRHYGGSWARLLRDFDPEDAGSFDEFERQGTLFLRPGGNGARMERRILGILAERYYQITSAAIRKHGGGALVLGDRYQSFYYPEVARAARRYVDVISTNCNAHWVDGSFARYFLRTLHELTGRPVQMGEFYMCATENRSGNRNSSAGFPVVPTQLERAAGFRRTILQAAKLPYVVGADWFQYYDEPAHGREDGEDYNMGLVDIHDVPYEEITQVAAGLDLHALHARAAGEPLRHHVPRGPGDPLADFTYHKAMLNWDRVSGYIEPSTKHAVADLYACWTPEGLYLGMHSMGLLENLAFRDNAVPECDRSLWTLRYGKPARTVEVRFGSGRPPAPNAPEVRVVSAEDGVRNVVAAVLPASAFGAAALRPGMVLSLDVALDTAGRCDHVRWKTRLRLE
jgi:hypothetical protein